MGPLMVAVVIYASSMAILTPAGCAPAGLLHGNREWIPSGRLRTTLLFACPIICLISLLIGYPLGTIIF